MTSDEFTEGAIALLRSAVGWQSAIARRLGIESRTVRRWLRDGATPSWVDERFRELMGAREAGPWPRDEWLLGDALGLDGRRREYIAHLAPPRFVARLVALDPLTGAAEPGELPADLAGGTVYQAAPELALCEIDWIDEVPAGQVTQLLEAAADAIEAIAGCATGRGGCRGP